MNMKEFMIRSIEEKAYHRIGRLAGELVRARPEEKELVLAEMQFNQWLAESCFDCL